MKKLLVIILLIILIIIISIFIAGRNNANQSLGEKNIEPASRPVIFILIDSLMSEPLQDAVQSGKAPALKFLMDKGMFYPDFISSYPTMSVSIDSTLLTGTYPDEHRLPGLVWYDEKEKRIINYGSAMEEMVKLGVNHVFMDHVYRLNNQHLSREVKTVHEELADAGMQSASINALIYRGKENKELKLSKTLADVSNLPERINIKTPPIFSYGAFAQYSPQNKENTQLWERYGFNDKFATEEMKYIIKRDKLPAFTIVYFGDLDQDIHKEGPHHLEAIEKVDIQIQEVLNSFDSWEHALKDKIWLVLGDSGQAPVKDKSDHALIHLADLLEDYSIHRPSESITGNEQIVLALNERMTYIYKLDSGLTFEEIASRLQMDSRIGFVAWKTENGVRVVNEEENKSLAFSPGGEIKDSFEQTWNLDGDLSILDLKLTDTKVDYGDYPDALARLHSALYSHEGDFLIADAKPGYEFIAEGTPTHPGGGSHGSLHKADSIVPLIVTGTDTKPTNNRILDLKAWIMQLMED